MNNPPLNSPNLPIHPTHTDAGVANDHTRVVPDCGLTDCGSADCDINFGITCGIKNFAGFRQVSKAEPFAILQAILEIPELGSRIFSNLSVSNLSRAERVSKCFRNNILL
ncbi:F-box protein, partial [Endozoicomonas sp. ONNA2]|uniref:F-box protein n=1 Tax=Endozoicomonas sp. ONNA2 TaxID=2828741 RepID=UPI0021480B4C